MDKFSLPEQSFTSRTAYVEGLWPRFFEKNKPKIK